MIVIACWCEDFSVNFCGLPPSAIRSDKFDFLELLLRFVPITVNDEPFGRPTGLILSGNLIFSMLDKIAIG